MTALMAFIGFGVALLLFLHLFRMREGLRRLIKAPKEKVTRNKLDFDQPGHQRLCPVCRRKLLNEEYLVCAMGTGQGQRRWVHIYGCQHCFKADNAKVQKI